MTRLYRALMAAALVVGAAPAARAAAPPASKKTMKIWTRRDVATGEASFDTR